MKKPILAALVLLQLIALTSLAEEYTPPKLKLRISKKREVSPASVDPKASFRFHSLELNSRDVASEENQQPKDKVKRDPSSVDSKKLKKFLPYKKIESNSFSPEIK